MPIPGAVSPLVPRAAMANLINGPALPVRPPAPVDLRGRLFDLGCFTAIVVLTGGLLARRFAPEMLMGLRRRHSPWARPPVELRGGPAGVRSEDIPFGEFLAALRAGPAASVPAEEAVDEQPHGEFYARAKEHLAAQRALLQGIHQESGDPARRKLLVELYFKFGLLKDAAGFPEVLGVWRVASSLEGLLKEHVGKIRNTTRSTLRTIESGLDLLEKLCVPGLDSGTLTARPFKFLVVDDELISRHALRLSLKKAFSEPDLAVDGPTALEQTAREAYDVIFLDVQMPGMDGFELCEKIHGTGPNRGTPVVFVTGHGDFEARARSAMVGGNDLMAKPFLIFEITTKALTLALQGRLLAQAPTPASAAGPAGPSRDAGAPATVSPGIAAGSAALWRQPARRTRSSSDSATEEFLVRTIEQLGPLRELCEAMLQAGDTATRQNLLTDGFLLINSFAANTPELTHPAFQLGSALEGLVRKLLQDSTRSTPGALATISTAVDLLTELCRPGLRADLAVNPPIRLLVVDDDVVARRALAGALQTVFGKPATAEDGEMAFAVAHNEPFDVIFLDLQMPGLNGFETCSKIRQTSCNRATPVVFVTAHADVGVRDEAVRSGGNDVVVKPFLTAEINVKALTLALGGRLQQAVPAPAAGPGVPGEDPPRIMHA